MNEKLRELYDLYVSSELITEERTSFEAWSNATEEQRQQLFELGKSKGLFKTSSAKDFSSVWGVVKKKEDSSQESLDGVRPAETEQRKGFRAYELLGELGGYQQESQDYIDFITKEQLPPSLDFEAVEEDVKPVDYDMTTEPTIFSVNLVEETTRPQLESMAAMMERTKKLDEFRAKESKFGGDQSMYFSSKLYENAEGLNKQFLNAGGQGEFVKADTGTEMASVDKNALTYVTIASENFQKLMEEEANRYEEIAEDMREAGVFIPYAMASRLGTGAQGLGAGLYAWFDSEGAQNYMMKLSARDRGFYKAVGLTEEEVEKGFSQNIDDGNFDAAITVGTLQLIQQVPTVAAAVGLSAMGQPTLGFTLLGASAGGQTYSELMMNPSVSKLSAVTGGMLVGIAEAGAEMVFRSDVDQLLRARDLAGTKGVREILDGKNLFRNLEAEGMSIVQSGAEESFEEFIVSTVEQSVDAVLTGSEFNAYELADAAVMGYGMGAGIRMTTLPSFFGSMKTTRKLTKITNEINKIEEELSSSEPKASGWDEASRKKISDFARKKAVLNERLRSLRMEASKILVEDAGFYEQMSDEDLRDITSINQKIAQAKMNYKRADSETEAKVARDVINENLLKKEQIENKYDRKTEEEVSSTEQEGQALVPAQPDTKPGEEETETSGDVPEPKRNVQLSVEEDTDYQSQIREMLQSTDFGRKFLKAVERVESAGKKFFPKGRKFGIQLLDMDEYVKKAEEYGAKNIRGFLDKETGTIYINVLDMSLQHIDDISSVPYHELAHLVIQKAFGGNSQLFIDGFKKMKNVILSTQTEYVKISEKEAAKIRLDELQKEGKSKEEANKLIGEEGVKEIVKSTSIQRRGDEFFAPRGVKLVGLIDNFISLYEEKGEAMQAEEGIVAIMEIIADKKIDLLKNESFRDSVRSLINSIFRKLGIGVNYTDKDIVDIINTFAKDVQVGKDVSQIKRRDKKEGEKKGVRESKAELFTFGSNVFNIDKGIELAKDVEEISIEPENVGKLRMAFVFKDEDTVNKADISKPVLLGTLRFGNNTGLMLLDGHHRVEKAFRDGKPIKAKALSEEQTSSIRESRGKIEIKDAKVDKDQIRSSVNFYESRGVIRIDDKQFQNDVRRYGNIDSSVKELETQALMTAGIKQEELRKKIKEAQEEFDRKKIENKEDFKQTFQPLMAMFKGSKIHSIDGLLEHMGEHGFGQLKEDVQIFFDFISSSREFLTKEIQDMQDDYQDTLVGELTSEKEEIEKKIESLSDVRTSEVDKLNNRIKEIEKILEYINIYVGHILHGEVGRDADRSAADFLIKRGVEVPEIIVGNGIADFFMKGFGRELRPSDFYSAVTREMAIEHLQDLGAFEYPEQKIREYRDEVVAPALERLGLTDISENLISEIPSESRDLIIDRAYGLGSYDRNIGFVMNQMTFSSLNNYLTYLLGEGVMMKTGKAFGGSDELLKDLIESLEGASGLAVGKSLKNSMSDLEKSDTGMISEYKDNPGLVNTAKNDLKTAEEEGYPLSETKQAEKALQSEEGLKDYMMYYQNVQSQEIHRWGRYLFSEVSSDKYFFQNLDNARKAFNYVLLHAIKNTNYDANRNKYIKRDNKSLRNYMPFNQGAVDLLFLQTLKDIEEGRRVNILESYSQILISLSAEIVESNSIREYETTDEIEGGHWLKFNQGRDTKESDKLSAIVQETPWCTKTMAASQLEGGDFYVYVTIGKKGQVNPRIAIRMDGDRFGEIKGVLSDQNLENSMNPVLERFLKSDFDKDKSKEYFEKIEFNNKAKALHKKVKAQGKWNKEDVSEMISLIQSPNKRGFGQKGGLNGFYERLELLSESLPGFNYFRLVEKTASDWRSPDSGLGIDISYFFRKDRDKEGKKVFSDKGFSDIDRLKVAKEIYLELKNPFFNASGYYKRPSEKSTREYIIDSLQKSRLAYSQDRLLPEASLYGMAINSKQFKYDVLDLDDLQPGELPEAFEVDVEFFVKVFDLLEAAEKIDEETVVDLDGVYLSVLHVEALDALGVLDKIFNAKTITSVNLSVLDYKSNPILSRNDFNAEIQNLKISLDPDIDRKRIRSMVDDLEVEIESKIKENDEKIKELDERLRTVRNNRDFDIISKEIDALENENFRIRGQHISIGIGDVNLNLADGANVSFNVDNGFGIDIDISVNRFTNAKKIRINSNNVGYRDIGNVIINTLEGLEEVDFGGLRERYVGDGVYDFETINGNNNIIVKDFGDVVTLKNFLHSNVGINSVPSRKLKNVFSYAAESSFESLDLLSIVGRSPNFFESVEHIEAGYNVFRSSQLRDGFKEGDPVFPSCKYLSISEEDITTETTFDVLNKSFPKIETIKAHRIQFEEYGYGGIRKINTLKRIEGDLVILSFPEGFDLGSLESSKSIIIRTIQEPFNEDVSGGLKVNAPNLKNFSNVRVSIAKESKLKNIDAKGTESFVKAINNSFNEALESKDIRESRGKLNLSGTQKQKMKGKTPLVDSAESSMKKSFNVPMMLKRGVQRVKMAFTDRQAPLRKALVAANARLAEAALTNRFGDNSNAKRLFLNFQKNIFLGLNSEETKYLDEMIILRRIIDIDRAHDNAGKKRIKHPKKYNKEIAEQKLQEMREALGDENFFEIENRAENYFDAFKFVIKRKVEEGLISLEEGIRFVNSDYSPRVFLETMFGKTGEKFSSDVISRGTNLSKSEVKKLKDGHDGDIFPDSEALLQMAFRTMETRIFANRFNIELSKLAGKVDWVKSGKKKPPGFSTLYYKEDGEVKSVFVKSDYYKLIEDPNEGVSNPADWSWWKKGITTYYFSQFLRGSATTYNPTFFITNIPMDYANVLMFTDVYDDVPLGKAMVQLQRDFSEISRGLAYGKAAEMMNVSKRQEILDLYEEAISYGVGMDFMTEQGKVISSQGKVARSIASKTGKVFEAIGEAASAPSNISEIAMRLAVYRRVKNSELSKGSSEYEAGMIAAAQARKTIDFSQGGVWSKNIDLYYPYFNAGLQGLRVAGSYIYRQAQTSKGRKKLGEKYGKVLAATIVMRIAFNMLLEQLGYDDDDKDLISQNDQQNYVTLPVGIKGEDGVMPYVRGRVNPNLTPLTNSGKLIGDYIYLVMKGELSEEEVELRMDKLIFNIQKAVLDQFSTIPVSYDFEQNKVIADLNMIPPFPKSVLSYVLNIDFFRNKKVSYDADYVGSVTQEYDERTEDVFKVIGKAMDMSPRRLQNSTEIITTSPSVNVFVSMAYAMANSVSSYALEEWEKSPEKRNSLLKKSATRVYKEGDPKFKALQRDILYEKEREQKMMRTEVKKKMDFLISEGLKKTSPKLKEYLIEIQDEGGYEEALYALNYFLKHEAIESFLNQGGNHASVQVYRMLDVNSVKAAQLAFENYHSIDELEELRMDIRKMKNDISYNFTDSFYKEFKSLMREHDKKYK